MQITPEDFLLNKINSINKKGFIIDEENDEENYFTILLGISCFLSPYSKISGGKDLQ